MAKNKIEWMKGVEKIKKECNYVTKNDEITRICRKLALNQNNSSTTQELCLYKHIVRPLHT